MPEIAATSPASSPSGITIAGHRIPFRVCLFWVGVIFWIGNMLFQTGSAGLAALWASFAFLIEMIVITSATRTIPLSQVARFCCWGGAMMSVVWLVDYGFTILQPDGNAVSRTLFTPFLEESLKLAPVLFYIWRQRRGRLRSLGASDILLLASACGAGFALVEDAYIQHHFGLWHPVSWMPTTAQFGASMTAGHQIWTALAGVTLGLALLWRPRKPFSFLLGASGFLYAMLDHFRTNFGAGHSGFIVDFLNFVVGRGWFSLYLFLIGLIAVIGSDLYAVRELLSSRPQLKLQGGKPPEGFARRGGVKDLWEFLVGRRSLAYVLFRCRRASGLGMEELAHLAALLERRLLRRGAGPVLQDKPTAAAGG